METITITNQKGGVSKTTTAWSLGVGLHKRGYRVLFVDLDAQSNLSFTANVDLLHLETTMYDVFKGNATVNDALITLDEGMAILVGGIDLASADREFTTTRRTYMLREHLEELQNDFDYCVIDTPPTLGVMNENALTASNKVIIPMKADAYAIQGIRQLKGFIDEQRKYTNPDLTIEGVLLTCVKERANLTKMLMKPFEQIAEQLDTKLYKATIRETISVPETALNKSNIYDYAPQATATLDYIEFVNEFLGTK